MRPPRTSRPRLLTAGLLSGGAAALLLAPSLADAAGPIAGVFGQTAPPTTEPATDTGDDSAGAAEAGAAEAGDELTIVEPGEHLREILQPLVDDGTITSEQLDAIVDSIRSGFPGAMFDVVAPILPGGPGGPGRADGPFPGGFPDMFPDVMGGGHHGPGFPGGIDVHGPGFDVEIGVGFGMGLLGGSEAIDLVANTIGITAPDLLDQLAEGSTIAEIATAAGADPQAVIDALVADVGERLDAAVQSGRITQAVADQRLETASERITSFVTGEEPSPDEAPAETTETTESTETTGA